MELLWPMSTIMTMLRQRCRCGGGKQNARDLSRIFDVTVVASIQVEDLPTREFIRLKTRRMIQIVARGER